MPNALMNTTMMKVMMTEWEWDENSFSLHEFFSLFFLSLSFSSYYKLISFSFFFFFLCLCSINVIWYTSSLMFYGIFLLLSKRTVLSSSRFKCFNRKVLSTAELGNEVNRKTLDTRLLLLILLKDCNFDFSENI